MRLGVKYHLSRKFDKGGNVKITPEYNININIKYNLFHGCNLILLVTEDKPLWEKNNRSKKRVEITSPLTGAATFCMHCPG
jgi:hypothetical protein